MCIPTTEAKKMEAERSGKGMQEQNYRNARNLLRPYQVRSSTRATTVCKNKH